jgi:hypothetical protein
MTRVAGGRKKMVVNMSVVGVNVTISAVLYGLTLIMMPVSLAQQPSKVDHSEAVSPDSKVPASGLPSPATPSTSSPVTSTTPPAVAVNAPPPASKSLGQLAIDALPGILTALLTALLAWFIGLRLTAGWDIRKKRAELDLQLIQDFNKVVAEFKAIGREREVLRERLRQTQGQPADDRKRIEEVRYELIKRAIAMESSLEALLLKLVSDAESWLTVHGGTADQRESARKQQLRTMGLFRVAFRNVREALVDGLDTTPSFGNPELWLFNRLAADLSGIVYQRATTPALPLFWKPWKITSEAAMPDTAAYLQLIAYRTIDLRMAVAEIMPNLARIENERKTARYTERVANVGKIFDSARTIILKNRTDPIPAGVVIAVEFVAQKSEDDSNIKTFADSLLQNNLDLSHYIAIADAPPRLLIVKRGEPLQTLHELDELPPDLPYVKQPEPDEGPYIGVHLLGWRQSQNMLDEIKKFATKPLLVS